MTSSAITTPSAVPPFLIIGQLRQVGFVLESPRIAVSAVAHEHTGQLQEKPSHGLLVIFAFDMFRRLVHQLQRTDTIPLVTVYLFSAAAMRSATMDSSDGPKPRVHRAGVPNRIPEASMGGAVSANTYGAAMLELYQWLRW